MGYTGSLTLSLQRGTKHYLHVLHVNFMYCRRRNNWAIPTSTCCIKGVSNNITSSILMTYWLFFNGNMRQSSHRKYAGCGSMCVYASITQKHTRTHRSETQKQWTIFFPLLFILLFPVIYCLLFWLLLVYRIFIPHFVYRQHAGFMYRKKMAASLCIFLFLSPHQPSSPLWCLHVYYV